MTPETITALLVVVFGAPLVAFLNAVFTRKKNVADAESVEVKTAIERNAGLWQEIGALNKAVTDMSRDLHVLRRRERIQRRLLHRHDVWDLLAARLLREAGFDLPDPPSLDVDDEPDPNGARTRETDYSGTTNSTPPLSERRNPP